MDASLNNTEQLCCLKREQILSRVCSCSNCDSPLCYGRKQLASCVCDDCKKCITHLKYSKQEGDLKKAVKNDYFDLINSVYLNTPIYAKYQRTGVEEDFRDYVNFELERKRVIEANTPTRFLPESKHSELAFQQERINIISDNDCNEAEPFRLNVNNYKAKEIKDEKALEHVNSQIALLVDKVLTKLHEACFCNCKCNTRNCKKCRHKNAEFENCPQIQSLTLTPEYQNFNPRTDNVSTEVMDLPRPSVSTISITSEQSNETTSKYDVFKRLKEVYKACSCKVCECIPTKLLKSEICDCKPCECRECKRFSVQLKTDQVTRKSLCNFYGKNVSCNPERNNNFVGSCDCKPCECINCKQVLPQIQDLFGQIRQNSSCQCSPCNCKDCLRGYNDRSMNFVHKIPKTTSRKPDYHYGMCPTESYKEDLDSCKCYSKHIAKKPFKITKQINDSRETKIIKDAYHYDNYSNESEKHKILNMLVGFPSNLNSAVSNTSSSRYEEMNWLTSVGHEVAMKPSEYYSCEESIFKNSIDDKPPEYCVLSNQGSKSQVDSNELTCEFEAECECSCDNFCLYNGSTYNMSYYNRFSYRKNEKKLCAQELSP